MRFPSFLQARSQRQRPSSRARFKRAARSLQVEQLEQRWCPSYSLITSRAALAGTDSVNWPAPPSPTQYLAVANPFTILSTGGVSITVSKTMMDNFETGVEAGPGVSGNFHDNFAPGDILLSTWDHWDTSINPITLNFGATAVAAGGAQIDPGDGGSKGINFTAELDAYDASGNLLASFTEKGVSTNHEDNSAIFLGISSTSANISQIALSIKDLAKYNKGDFTINKFDFRTSPLAPTLTAAPAARQPSSALDLAPLASSLLGTGQQDLPAAPLLGLVTPTAPPASTSGTLPASGASSPALAGATDAIFVASHAGANDDGAWPFAPLSSGSLDAM